MKQKITYEQWQSLSEEAQLKLQAWWKLRTPPLLSIGQMIEFLEDSGGGGLGCDDFGQLTLPNNGKNDICDDLWEEVKGVLDNDP